MGKSEISGNICDKTQRMAKMRLWNTVNLCSHTGRRLSLWTKHFGCFMTDAETLADLSTATKTGFPSQKQSPRQQEGSSFLLPDDYGSTGHVMHNVWGSTNQKEGAAALHQGWPHYGFTN